MRLPETGLHVIQTAYFLAVKRIRAIDLFCGAGGSSWGARLAGVNIVAGFDMWSAAKQSYPTNFPKAAFYERKLEEISPRSIKQELGKIDLILASPECQSHSQARGAAKRSKSSRDTAFQVVRFAKTLKPRWIVIENVASMRTWSRYNRFKRDLEALGYQIREQILNAADFGVPQRRKRLFLLCDKLRGPEEVKPTRGQHTTASTVIDTNGSYSFSPLKQKRRASSTLQRAGRAVRVVGKSRSFLIVYYGTDKAGGWQRLDVPLRTITTLDRFALVKPGRNGHMMRMLQVPELKQAMGMPKKFKLGSGSRREQIHLLGNAVCPPVMRAVVRSLVNCA